MRKNLMRLLAAAVLLALLPAMAMATEFAVVRGGRLNLREYPDADSDVLGKYGTGSWVRLDSRSGGWWYVRTMDGKRGYMDANYLNTGASQNQGTVNYANGGYVNLRTGPSLSYDVVMRVTSGSTVYIQNNAYEWNYVYVYVNGTPVYGYMHDSFINSGASGATIVTRNGGRVNLRSGPDSSYSSVTTLPTGTAVSVLLKGNNWYKISANGYVGYMSTQYLSSGSTTGGSSTGTTTSSTVAYVNNPKSTQVLNLRESPSQNSRSIGQYRNGTKVKVVSRGATWCEVYVGTSHGYMMTRYLSFNGSYLPPSYVQPTQPPAYYWPTVTATPRPNYWATPEPVYRPTATPVVQYITPKPQYSGPAVPQSGDYVWLAIAAGSSSNRINVYNDASMTSLKATYSPGKQVMMLKYGTNSCMVYVDGGVAHVSTWNINY